jgi:PAS domain S-box-containing protein
MINPANGDETGEIQKKRSPPLFLGFLPVLLLFALVLFEYLSPSSVRVYEPALLLPLLNTSLFLAACVVSYIAMRIYLISGSPAILWIGCGVLTLGTGSLAAGWLIVPYGPNVNVTVFNVGAFLASICHIGAVVASLGERPGEADPSRRKRNARLGYLAVLIVIALLILLTITGTMPPFFIQGVGPTEIRQNVAGWTIVLFTLSSLFTMHRFLRQQAPFLYWYSLALALVALAMLAFFLQPAVGSPIGWVGRSSYVLGGIYFLISVVSGLREARTQRASLHRRIAELLEPGLHWPEILATVSDGIISYDDQGKILLWSKAAQRIFGYPEAAVVGKGLDLILPGTQAISAQGLANGITEIELQRHDGSRFSAEVSVSSKSSSLGVITSLVIRDITERKRAEAALREREAQLQTILDSLTEGLVVSDLEGNLFHWNPAALAMHGFTSMAECRRRLPELVDTFELSTPEDGILPVEQWPLARILRGETLNGWEVQVRSLRAGWQRLFGYSGTMARDKDGKPLLAVVAVNDITARKRDEEALRRSNQRLDLLAETANRLLTSVSPQRVVDDICPKVMEYLDCQAFFNFLVDEKEGRLHLNAVAGIPEEEALRIQWLDYGVAVCGCAARDACRIVAENIPTTNDPRTELVKSYGIQAYACHPLLVEGRVLGTLSFGTRTRTSFTDEELALMKAVADQVAIAMNRKQAEEALTRARDQLEQRVQERTAALQEVNEQLLREVEERRQAEAALRDSEERLKYLTSQLITAQEQERQHIGMELHDDLGQLLMVLKMQLRTVSRSLFPEAAKIRDELEDGINFINEIIERVRRLSRNLRPTVLEDLGLAAALKLIFEDFRKYHGLELTEDLDDIQDLFAWQNQILIYRIFQESLTNVAKHAGATAVAVSIKKHGGNVTFRLEDNGHGFDLKQILERDAGTRGLGLAAMDERVRMLGGLLDIQSLEGQGTRIAFSVSTLKE